MDSAGLVLAHGLVNWIATVIVAESEIFREPRLAVQKWHEHIDPRNRFRKFLARKLCYFASCALCVGVWIGFVQAAAFDGPLHPEGWWASWAAFLANGLLYKAVGHLILQVNAWFHVSIQSKQRPTRHRSEEAPAEPQKTRDERQEPVLADAHA